MKNTEDEIAELIYRAEHGEAEAQEQLGTHYREGKIVPKDFEKARYWYSKAAGQNNIRAQACLDFLNYEEARNVFMYKGSGTDVDEDIIKDAFRAMCSKDYEKSSSLFKKAADQGHAGAQYALGEFYEDGLGLKQNYEMAVYYYTKASEQGHREAQNNLGVLYHSGRGVSQNKIKARELHIKSAAQGYKNAQRNLDALDYGSGGCYIATAVYGSYDAPEVLCLRQFRDETLSLSILGRLFIKFYYFFSPTIAERLKNTRYINAVIRKILDMFVHKTTKFKQ